MIPRIDARAVRRELVMKLGVYIHFPWCRRRCPYCDFAIAVAPLDEIPHQRYAEAVLGELSARAPRFAKGRSLVSMYFGGGTPALWRADWFARVITCVREAFSSQTQGDIEITCEANPNDCDMGTLSALRDAGINRLSIGTQSFDADTLVSLGRDHGAGDSLRAVAAARASGFDSVSLDLMFALAGQTQDDWQRTLDQALAQNPDHLSVYQLTIEPRTTFGARARNGVMPAVAADDESAAAMFEQAHTVLESAGYVHYEVSSYARPGRLARHNSLYWEGAEVLGLGSGAHSFCLPSVGRGLRWASHRSVKRYLQASTEPLIGASGDLAQDPLVASFERLDATELQHEAIWLGLRTLHGVPQDWFSSQAAELGRLLSGGALAVKNGRVRPTLRGYLMADEIAVQLLK